jgi:hypothetical protein
LLNPTPNYHGSSHLSLSFPRHPSLTAGNGMSRRIQMPKGPSIPPQPHFRRQSLMADTQMNWTFVERCSSRAVSDLCECRGKFQHGNPRSDVIKGSSKSSSVNCMHDPVHVNQTTRLCVYLLWLLLALLIPPLQTGITPGAWVIFRSWSGAAYYHS